MQSKLESFQNQIKDPKKLLAFTSITFLLGLAGGVVFKSKIRNILNSLGLVKGQGWSNINFTEAGARSQKELQKGKHPIQLHSLGTPNGEKVTILLEELGLKYDAYCILIGQGQQFQSGFVQINPNSKIPAMIDYTDNQEKGVRIFESGSILLYLAERNGKFIPKDPSLRTECINLLFMQMGLAPYIGQLGHFNNYAPKGFWYDHQYSYNRYATETQRIVSVLNNILADRKYLVGDEYTIADIAWYPWINCIQQFYKQWDVLNLNRFTHVVRWLKDIKSRPAVEKGMKINQPWNGPEWGDYHSPDN